MQVDYGASSISQWALTEFLDSGYYDEYLIYLRKELKERRNFAVCLLDKYFKDLADWSIPEGGFYIWLRFKKPVSIEKLFQMSLENNILLNPGNIYDFSDNNALRLSYAYADLKDFEKAIKTLSDITLKCFKK